MYIGSKGPNMKRGRPKKELWNLQEKECLKCKTSSGCKDCSIKKYYNIKDCKIFKTVFKKRSLQHERKFHIFPQLL